jgi:predicted SAM-dependent methyltransferase
LVRFLNPQVSRDLLEQKPLKLNLGAGGASAPGFYGIDVAEQPGVDIVADLNEPLDLLPDDCAEFVRSRHTLEHVVELTGLLREIRRITRRDGRIEIIVPHFTNTYAYSDPTHVRFFGIYSMNYFVDRSRQRRRKVPNYTPDVRFHVDSIRIAFYRRGVWDRLTGPFMTWFVNLSFGTQEYYERRLSSFFHAWEIRYRMRPDK